ncbi:tyrosine-type recombinase/integrase [Peptococcaceae bacterium 1198_IL3148]
MKEDIKIDVFTNYQIKQMLNYYKRVKNREKSFFAYRDYTMIIVFLGTGMRLGEVVNLRWKDINWENNTITVFGKKRIQSSLPITDKLKNELAEYKIFVQQVFKKPCEYVFALKDNKQMTSGAVKCVFKRLKDKMNFNDVRLSPHTFRHTENVKSFV